MRSGNGDQNLHVYQKPDLEDILNTYLTQVNNYIKVKYGS
jgi:hypothetical protein